MLKQTPDIPLTGEYAHKLNIDFKEEATLEKSLFLFRYIMVYNFMTHYFEVH